MLPNLVTRNHSFQGRYKSKGITGGYRSQEREEEREKREEKARKEKCVCVPGCERKREIETNIKNVEIKGNV